MDIPLEDSKETVLILAGDTCEVNHLSTFVQFLEQLSNNYKKILIIFGNHEYYAGAIPRSVAKLNEKIVHLQNVIILQRQSIVIDDVTIIGATLWTDLGDSDPFVMMDAQARMNDYHYIRAGTSTEPYKFKLLPIMTINEHRKDLNFIKNAVDNATTSKIVVITHHAACELSTMSSYRGNSINRAYYTPLEDYIYDSNIDFWISGHCHNSSDYEIGKTRMISNPRGYAHKIYGNQNKTFKDNFIIDV